MKKEVIIFSVFVTSMLFMVWQFYQVYQDSTFCNAELKSEYNKCMYIFFIESNQYVVIIFSVGSTVFALSVYLQLYRIKPNYISSKPSTENKDE